MILLPGPWWPTVVLALIIFSDAILTALPPRFVRDCLTGVRFPREWWWTLVVVKLLAAAGLLLGLAVPGVAFAANAGVVAYFAVAGYAHIRVRFMRSEFWVNCLGMLALSLAVLLVSYLG
ncbi:DoxX-like family protein [Paramicrobacterium humi]|uniref:DoxX-like family protein n=1 Tax=Paramicrobacterium humi TaxID=640635 RepID=A0A1H4K1K2_9MICO|nr:DoxX family protein [Microbacterium humi]SEB52400.1 DoxX-like family protein [Microbacterium humi]